MNNPEFQKDFFSLEKNEQLAFIKIFKKIQKMNQPEVYADHALKWEVILSKTTTAGDRIYSFRFSQKYRATALRENTYLRLLTLHIDHDSTYR
jgi:hypothetical protein